jgi:N-acyl-D-aspartate/D-glutamate deacylase
MSVDSMRAGTRLISDEDVSLLRFLADESGGIVTFIPVLSKAGEPAFHSRTLEKLGSHLGRIVPQSAVLPLVFVQMLTKPFKFGYYNSFRKVMNRPASEQLEMYRSPAWRKEAKDELDGHERRNPWERTRILTVENPDLKPYVGRVVTEIGKEEGKHPLDVLVGLACQDELKLRYEVERSNHDQDGIAWMLGREEFLVGLSDGGAHVDQICDSRYPSVMIGRWVRERKVLDLETAVKKMTSVPAQVFGVPDRGVLETGKVADLVLFDPERVGWEAPHFVQDLPLGADRLISHSQGMVATFVAGTQVSQDGRLTGERPGAVIRCRR